MRFMAWKFEVFLYGVINKTKLDKESPLIWAFEKLNWALVLFLKRTSNYFEPKRLDVRL